MGACGPEQRTHSVDAGPLLSDLQEAGDDDGQLEGRGGDQLLDGEVGDAHGLASLHPHLLHLLIHVVSAAQAHHHCSKTRPVSKSLPLPTGQEKRPIISIPWIS